MRRLHFVAMALAALAAPAAPAGAQDSANPFATGIDRRAGENGFRVHCSLCHGYDARGGPETSGPDLTTGRFRHAATPQGLFEVIRHGVEGTAMLGINPDVPDRLVWQIITYLDTLSPRPSDVELPGNAARGQQLFSQKGNCASCHMVNGEGGRRGPDLSRVGERRTPDELRADLLDPDGEVDPRWWTVRATRPDGSVIEGLRLGEDTFTFRLIDDDERLWALSKSDLRTFEQDKRSTMPSADATLTASEIDDLVAYLFTLRTEN